MFVSIPFQSSLNPFLKGFDQSQLLIGCSFDVASKDIVGSEYVELFPPLHVYCIDIRKITRFLKC